MNKILKKATIFYSTSFAGFFWALLGLQLVQVFLLGRSFIFDDAAVRAVRGSIAAPFIFTFIFILMSVIRQGRK